MAYSASVLNRPVNSAIEGLVHSKLVSFTEDATSTTHTGTVVIPAGSQLLDILVWTQVLWGDSSAAIIVGDATDDDGWMTTCQLDTTDLILGERFAAASDNNWGGVNGAYLTTAGRFGPATGDGMGGYYAAAGSVIGKVTVSTPSATTGRAFMNVIYATPSVTAATLS